MTAGVSPVSLVDELTPAEQVSLLAGADFWHTACIERLGIPALRVSDGPVGARGTRRDGHDGAGDEPDQRLVGFTKRAVPAEASITSLIELDPRTYQAWHVGIHAWIGVPGAHELRVGTSSRDISQRFVLG